MTDISSMRDKAFTIAKAATELDNEKKYQEAVSKYTEAIEHFMFLVKYDKNPAVIPKYKAHMEEYLKRAEYLKKAIQEGPIPTSAQGGSNINNNGKESKNDENDKFKKVLSEAIVTEKPNVKWDDVAGLDQAKASLQEAVILPAKFPQFFVGNIKPWKGILLYGPPGTGKSYLAKACATESNATFFSVSSSDLVSKWLGESEKLVRTLFDLARKSKPAVIFIDEIDSLCGRRKEDENDSVRRIKTEFLVQMQGVGKDDTGYLILGATNIPWELDPAIRRRFERKIYISLPEEFARKSMFKIHLGKTPHTLTDNDFAELAMHTPGYSGSDIFTVVKEASMEPIRKCQSATWFKQDSNGFYYPSTQGDGIQATLLQIPDSTKVKSPLVCMDDFRKAIIKMKPTVNQKDIDEQMKFTKEFGMEGN